MDGRPHLGSPHPCQTRFGMLSIPPHLKVLDSSHKPFRIDERLTYPFFTTMALMGWIQVSLSFNNTPTFLHRPYMRKGCPRPFWLLGYRGWRPL